MKVIPETRRAHEILYLRFYYVFCFTREFIVIPLDVILLYFRL